MKILNLKGIGALPVGFKGKINGKPFSIRVQYDAFGGVKAQIFSDSDGSIVTSIQGNRGETDSKGAAFGQWALIGTDLGAAVGKYYEKSKDDIRKRAKAFVKQLHSEVVDFNKGKDTRIKKVSTVVIAPKPVIKKPAPKPTAKKATPKPAAKKAVVSKAKQTGGSNLKRDRELSAMNPGKRASGPGAKRAFYYEYRRNRTDQPGKKI